MPRDGVPFMMKAGKALHKRQAEIRIQFRHAPGNLYKVRAVQVDSIKTRVETSARLWFQRSKL